jgi:hypothetical protein
MYISTEVKTDKINLLKVSKSTFSRFSDGWQKYVIPLFYINLIVRIDVIPLV